MKKKLYILIISLVIISFATSSFIIFFIPALLPNKIGIGSSQEKVDYLIITSESLLSTVEPLAIWKQQRGLTTAIVTVEEIAERYEGSDMAETIRNCIKQFYVEKEVKWVLLAGNREFIPTRLVKFDNKNFVCDQYYANLDDNWILNSDASVSLIDQFDWDLEVYIGRLPAEDKDNLELLVQRLLEYEKNPPIGPWMTHAIFGGAYAHFSYDLNDNSIFDDEDVLAFDANRVMNWINNQVLPTNWTSSILAEAEGIVPSEYYYDIPLNEANIVSELNSGAGIGILDAHGLTVGMSRTIFTIDEDGDKLVDDGTDVLRTILFIDTHSEIDVNGKNGFYFLSACETGNFEGAGVSLTEYILRTCGIGCISSSRSAWYEADWTERNHGGWSSQGLYVRFWKQLFLNGINQPGKAFGLAKVEFVQDYLNFYGLLENDNTQTLIQYNLLGDPEVPIWTIIPHQLEYIVTAENNNLMLQAICKNQTVDSVVVTLTNNTYFWKGYTDSDGELIIPVSFNELNDLTLTLSKNNYLINQKLSNDPLTSFPDYSS